MAEEPKASEQGKSAEGDKHIPNIVLTILKTENKPEIGTGSGDKTNSTGDAIEPAKPVARRAAAWFKKKAEAAHLADWAMVFFTLIIAGATIAYTVYARRQWQVMSGQLAEMRNGGTDTHELAVQAKNQAGAAKSLADQAKAQTDKMVESLTKTDALIGQLTAQTRATNELAKQAKISADAAIDARRARLSFGTWTLMKFEPGSIPEVSYILSNTGGTPAILKELRQGGYFGDVLPDTPQYLDIVPLNGLAVYATVPARRTSIINGVTDQLIRLVTGGMTKYWLYFMVSFSDIFGEHKVCDVVVYDLALKSLARDITAPSAYECSD